MTTPANYYYTNASQATFSLANPLTVLPVECEIVYSCAMTPVLAHDLCSYTGGTTTTTFSSTTGAYSIASEDNQVFGTQLVSFTITATSGSDTETLIFTLNLIDPCEANIVIDPSIISSPINYDIYPSSPPAVYALDSNQVSYSPTSPLCSALELRIVNSDNTSLNAVIF